MRWMSLAVLVIGLLGGVSVAQIQELSIRGLTIGREFDQSQLRPLLERMVCTAEQACQGYLYILNRPSFTQVAGTKGKISKVELSFDGTQYASIRDALTGKYGKPKALPDSSFGKAPNFVVESQRVEWRDAGGAVLLLSEDLKVQIVTLTLSAARQGIKRGTAASAGKPGR